MISQSAAVARAVPATEKYKERLIHQPPTAALLLFAAESIGRNTFDKMQLLGMYLLGGGKKRTPAGA